MKLFYTKRSPYARKIRILALEKKINLEFIEEDLTKKSEKLLKANPLGKIPALVLDNGEVIFDSPVICQYLDSLAAPRLIPESGKEKINILKWEAFSDGVMDISVALFMEKARHPNDFNQAFVTAQEETIKRCLSYINDHTKELKDLSLASIAVISAVGYAQFRLPYLVEKEKYKNLFSWVEEFSKRASVATTIPSG